MSSLKVGSIVSGTVVVVEDNLAYIGFGGKTEGRIYLEYYTSDKNVKSLKDVLKVNDVVKVQISKITPDLVMLSRLEIEEKEKRDKVVRKIMNHKPFTAQCTGKNKEGEYLLNKDGVNLILPANYVDLKADFDADSIIGTEVKVMFAKSETDERGRTRFIVTRKQVQYNEERKAREDEFEKINVDDVLTGTVVRITEFGAFVKFDAVEGLCHLSEISHYHIKSASECLEIGQEVQVKVIKKTENKLHLSIKALQKTPWELFLETHKVGDVIECTIVKKSEKYMLCSPERDVIGILNQSDYSWNRDDNFASTVEEGSKVNLQITYIDKSKDRMTLSKKHLEYNPWQDTHIKLHEVVTGTVERFTNTGAIIKVGNVEGFLPNKDASETGKSAQEVLKVGDVINAEVTAVNPQRWLLTLSIRSIEEAKTREYVDKYIAENVSSDSSLGDLFKDEMESEEE